MSAVFTAAQLAKLIDAEIQGDANTKIESIAPIASAQPGQLTYLIGGQYRKYLDSTRASVVLLNSSDASFCNATKLIVPNPEVSYAKIAELFAKKSHQRLGAHPNAIIGMHCNIYPSASIGAHCTIGDRVTIGQHTVIMPGVVIGDDVVIGEDCVIYGNVTIYQGVSIAARAIIHAGAVIGADGFGFANSGSYWKKIPQLGSVVIEEDVEIGANTCIDRGAIENTTLRKGVKLDNLIQVGHNVEIGEHTIIAGCTAIAGSVKIGKRCMIGGKCTINGHVSLSDGVVLTGMTTVGFSIEEAGVYSSGLTAKPHKEWLKTVARLSKLGDLAHRISKLESLQNDNHE